MLRFAKSLSLVRNAKSLALAYSQIFVSAVLLRPIECTCADSGNRSAKSPTIRGGRFSSTRSFKNRYPFRNAGKELINGLKVFPLKVGKLFQNLILRHPRREIGSQIVDRKPQAANTGLSAHLARFYRDAWVQVGHRLALSLSILCHCVRRSENPLVCGPFSGAPSLDIET